MKGLFCEIDYQELRYWLILILAVIGAIISILTFRNTLKHRKLENTYKTINFIRKHITVEQIDRFIELFQANNFLTGVKENEFKFADGNTDTVEDMFSEGGCGNGDIHNLIELFNLVSPKFKNLNYELIWFEYGQVMQTLYKWTSYLANLKENEQITFYKDFNHFMKKNEKSLSKKPSMHYTYIE